MSPEASASERDESRLCLALCSATRMASVALFKGDALVVEPGCIQPCLQRL